MLGIRHLTPSMLDRCQEIMYWRSVPYQVRLNTEVQWTALKYCTRMYEIPSARVREDAFSYAKGR